MEGLSVRGEPDCSGIHLCRDFSMESVQRIHQHINNTRQPMIPAGHEKKHDLAGGVGSMVRVFTFPPHFLIVS